MKKYRILSLIIALLTFIIVSCDPSDDFDGSYTARKGISIENKSGSNIEVLHISGSLYISSGDSTMFVLKKGETKTQWEAVKDRDIYTYLKEEWN